MNYLVRHQNIPVSLEEAWDFFSKPGNLRIITPEYLDFRITGNAPSEKMYPGMIITYRIRPVMKISMQWATEITQVKEPFFFADNQLSGPYKFWHHQHLFREIQGGVRMTDIVHYAAPVGMIGKLTERLYIDKKVKEIFDYRYNKVVEIFGNYDGSG